MKAVRSILNRSIAAPYYRRHAGVFLFIFFVLFGLYPHFQQTLELHYVIMDGITTSRIFFFVALLIWLLYTAKTIHFFQGCTKTRPYHFLQIINGLSPSKRFFQLLLLQLQLLAPVLGYGLAVIIIAFINEHIAGGLLVILTLISVCVFSTITTYFLLQKTSLGAWRIVPASLQLHFPANLFSFLLKFVFSEQLLSLAILKLLSFSCLYFFAKTDAGVFEERMLWFLFLTSLAGHSMLVYRNQYFIETKMPFYRNLPITPLYTLFSLFCVYVIVLIPEIWAMKAVAVQQHAAVNYLWIVLTGPSFLLLLHCLLYTEDMKMEEFLKLLFGVWIVTIFFSLSSHHWILPLACLFISVVIFFTSFHRYEKNTEVEGLE